MPPRLLEWSDALSVGIEEIDAQHKVLIDLLNELHTAVLDHHGSAECRVVLDRLAEYTRVHFAVEESLMRIFAYPDYEAHRHEHEMLTAQVVELQKKLDSGKTAITFELLHFLRGWLAGHILQSDKHYGPYFIARGIETRLSAKPAGPEKQQRFWQFWSH